MRHLLSGGVLVLALVAAPAAGRQGQQEGPGSEADPIEPVEYLLSALQEHPIVCLAEGGHGAKQPHLFLRRVLGNEAILRALDVIVVEFANARHQDALDAYVAGEEIPFSRLSPIWRDTGQSPRAPWDSPLYQQLLATIREGNRALPPEERVRVLAGDPPMRWEEIRTREDYHRTCVARDPYVASLVMEQAFRHDKRVLVLFGGAHLPRVPIAEGDTRGSLTWRILAEHPDAVEAIGFLIPENLGVAERTAELVTDRIYRTDRHWSGGIDAEKFFREIYSRVTDPETGAQSWQQVPLYTGRRVGELFDALVYIGPASGWEHVPASWDLERDAAYLEELDRRSKLRFGRPLNR